MIAIFAVFCYNLNCFQQYQKIKEGSMNKLDLIKTTRAYLSVIDDFSNGKLPHCNLLIAPDNMSCELFASAFASFLICKDEDEASVHNVNKRIHPDVFFLPKTGTLKVDDVEFVLERLNYFPMQADVKIFVLEKFSDATVQAQNKLLKTLEEPPANTYFLLTSEKEDGILPTIRSRCRRLDLEPLNESVINILMLEYNVDAKRRDIATFYGRGQMGKIDFAMTNDIVENFVDLSFDIIKHCKSSKDLLAYTNKLTQNKSDLKLFLQIYADVLSEILRVKILNKENEYAMLDFQSLKNELSENAIIYLLKCLRFFDEMLARSCNPILIIDNLLIETCRCANFK